MSSTHVPIPASRSGRSAARRLLVLSFALAVAVPLSAQFPGLPVGSGMPVPDEGLRTPLVALPPLPPGTEMTFTPFEEAGGGRKSPDEVLREAQERALELTQDLQTIGQIPALPEVGSAAYATLRSEAMGILQRRFQESRAKLEPDAKSAYSAHVSWTPNFSPAPRTVASAEQERAREASYSVAYAVTHLNRPHFVVAWAGAIFALDPESALGAENAASALLAAAERLYPEASDVEQRRPFREDAAVVYRYALARSVTAGKWGSRSLGILINLGNLYVDLGAPELARPVLLAAQLHAPTSWDAAVAMASCYTLQGRPQLARAVLEDPRLARSSLYARAVKGARQLSESLDATDLSPDSEPEEFEAVLKAFDRQETLTAADFVAELDQSERNRMRAFLDNLPVQGSYHAPEIDGVTQFSTMQAINQPAGIGALGEFAERTGSYAMQLYARMIQQQQDAIARLGLGLQLNIDLNDAMQNPHKYRNHEVKGTVTGVDQLKARLEQMKAQALQARSELAMGRIDTLLQMGAASDPMIAVFALQPNAFANPMDVVLQQYNASMLGRKLHAYSAYFFAVNRKTRESLTEIAELYAQKIASIREQEDAAMTLFQQERAAAAKAGQNTGSVAWRRREHKLHQTYLPQYNDAGEHAWKQATQTASLAYEQKIKPRAERFYYDVFRHVALISDPAVRERKNRDFQQMLHFGVYQGLVNVLAAFGGYEHTEEWDCHCNLDELNAQELLEKQELDRIAELARARDQQEKLRFKAGKVPEASPLFQKLDAYGTDLKIPFIPMLGGRISCARTTLTLGADFPGPYAPKLAYAFSEDAFTGATTHGGSVAIGVKVKGDPVTASATVNVKGSVSLDGKGVVTDYSVTGGSEVKFELGPATLGGKAEIGYTPVGGLTSDVSGSGSVSIKDAFGSVTLTYETSARRGNSLSAKAERSFNPNSDFDKMINESMGPLGDLYKVDTGIKQEIWSGKFQL